jgi:hypothetical protein
VGEIGAEGKSFLSIVLSDMGFKNWIEQTKVHKLFLIPWGICIMNQCVSVA